MLNSITRILEKAHQSDSSIRPTELYNEGWMLKIVLDWFAHNSYDDNKLNHPFTFHHGAKWYSEAILPTHFKPRTKSGDKVAESRTHADGVIGHFQIQENTKAGFQLLETATQFVVIEAKMKSKLSQGTTKIADWDQAARNIACMAEAVARVEVAIGLNSAKPTESKFPETLSCVGFYVTAPAEQINKHKFHELLSKDSIREKVQKRVLGYYGKSTQNAEQWLEQYFMPLMDRIKIESISWESIIELIRELDPVNGEEISQFYEYCLKFN